MNANTMTNRELAKYATNATGYIHIAKALFLFNSGATEIILMAVVSLVLQTWPGSNR